MDTQALLNIFYVVAILSGILWIVFLLTLIGGILFIAKKVNTLETQIKHTIEHQLERAQHQTGSFLQDLAGIAARGVVNTLKSLGRRN